MFIAYYSDGQCSGPYHADNDKVALATGKSHAIYHEEYNKLPTGSISINAIKEIEMFKNEKGNNWYMKTPLTSLRAVNINDL
jgi:hypothetical protein